MEDIEPFIPYSGDQTDDIDFAGKENQQRELSYCEPARSNADSLIVLLARNILLDKFEGKNEG